jgi:hypothetical protein
MKQDNHNFPGFIKQTDKDVVVICIFNNDKKDKEPKDDKCVECIEALPGLSPGENPMQPNGTGQERNFVEFLLDNAEALDLTPDLSPEETIAEFCENLVRGVYDELEIALLIDAAFPGEGESSFALELFECLTDLIDTAPPMMR